LPVTNIEDLVNAIEQNSKLGRKVVLLRIKAGDQSRFVAVQLKKS